MIIDAEAGVEHFGRRVDAACDLIIGVVDPTHESFPNGQPACPRWPPRPVTDIRYILNKVDHRVAQIMAENVDTTKVIARIPNMDSIFTASLEGRSLGIDSPEIAEVVTFLDSYQKETHLNVI